MGLGPSTLLRVVSLLEEFSVDVAYADLGAQELHYRGEPEGRRDIEEVLDKVAAEADSRKEILARIDEIPIQQGICVGDPKLKIPVGEILRNSGTRYLALDAFESGYTTKVDLNEYSVPQDLRGKFDLTGNFGTTEHVFNQYNAFKVAHDLTKTNGIMIHDLPACGYFNHGLFNYHPKFFTLLANANGYEIAEFVLTGLTNGYQIPAFKHLSSEDWRNHAHRSGGIWVVLRKTSDEAFQMFSDYDSREVDIPYNSEAFVEMSVKYM